MNKTLSLMIVAGLAASAQADGEVIAFTSFENAFVGAQYVDTGDASVDHDMVNNAGQSDIDFLADGVEIGYNTEYFNSRNSVGATDGDFIGATSFTGTVGAFTDGVQGFELQDADGTFRTNFDTVNSPLGPNSRIEFEWNLMMDFYVQATGWELDDRIHIWVDADGTQIDILNTAGMDINDLGIEGSWQMATVNLTGFSSVTLHAELESNSGSESLYLDNIVFKTGTGVPAPASLALLGLGGLAATRRRR